MKAKQNTILLAILVVFALSVLVSLYGTQMREGFQSGANSFTMYYADWCPHCKAVKPAFSDFASGGSIQVKGQPVFLKMVEAEQNPEEAKGKPVRGYPTFLLEKADGSFKEFDGDRTAAGWKSFLEANL
jgi:thiol-disulfide isomerase/thioredoxin